MQRNIQVDLYREMTLKYGSYLDHNVLPVRAVSAGTDLSRPVTSLPGTPPFTYFTSLPYELRRSIWLMALRDTSQDVGVVVEAKEDCHGMPGTVTLTRVSVLPRIMRVSLESYKVGVTFYERAFAPTHRSTNVYFNFGTDCLTVWGGPYQHLGSHFASSDLGRLRYLRLPLRCWLRESDDVLQGLLAMLCRFPSLTKLWLLIGDGNDDRQFAEDKRHILRVANLVKRAFRKVYGRKCEYPEVDRQMVPALMARRWEIDGLQY
jgi:hypothetical protein